ncbi:excalibur calcium-binding domain-containing protein [Streptomyces chartreusis]|uniref:excalibur calcium-binding domain-containing protein n=1 Tax=Streptomyces chartreusis TaxID=1969 RepID=UPI0036268AB7
MTAPEPPPSDASPYYENCDEARAAGAVNIHEGEPGYAPRQIERGITGNAAQPDETTIQPFAQVSARTNPK